MAGEPQHQQLQNPSFLLDALYCEDENWEQVSDSCFREEEEDEEESLSYYYSDSSIHCRPPLMLLEHDLFWEEGEISCLISKEEHNHLHHNLDKNNPSLARLRREAVEWMLNVTAHYSFSALTAVLAVNYLDRFLSSFNSHSEKLWMTQLAAVACLSLAAKVEETQVPLLLDLQVEEAKYVFEAKTIERMEILVLSTLQWKMNPVTPLSFVDYFTRRLGLKSHLCWEFLKRCQCLLLFIISDCRFMPYLPSVVASAIMLHVINNVEPSIGLEFQTQLLSIIDKGKVEECYKLIQEMVSLGHFYPSKKRKFGSTLGSPKGVMDVSFSSDRLNDSWAVAAAASSVSSSSDPCLLSKKSRTTSQDPHNLETADILCFPR